MNQPDRRARAISRRDLLLLAGAASALAAAPVVRAQSAAKLTIVYPTRSGASWPLWIAQKAGLYEKHGLDVKLEFGVHPAGIAMVISNQAQMTNYGMEQILSASVRDPAFVMTGSSLNKGNFAMVAQKGMKKPADLKGKRVGIGRLGDPLYNFTLDLLRVWGMNERDVQWVPTGTDSKARAKMFLAGQLDASLMVAPTYFELEKMGYEVVDLLINHPDIYVSTAYLFTKAWAKDHGDEIRRIIMAQTEAIARFYADKAFAVQTYLAFDKREQADVEQLYDLYKSRDVLDRVPLVQKAAVASAIARTQQDVPALKTFDPAQIIDMSIVRQLIADGYFRKVFGDGIAAEEQRKLAASF